MVLRVTPEQILTGVGLTLAASIAAPAVRRMLSTTKHRGKEDALVIFSAMGNALSNLGKRPMKAAGMYLMEEFDDFQAEVDYERQQIRARRRPMEEG